MNSSSGTPTLRPDHHPAVAQESPRGWSAGYGAGTRFHCSRPRTTPEAVAFFTARWSAGPRFGSSTAARYGREHVLLEMVHAGAVADPVRLDPQEEARAAAARPVALPEPQVEVGLVRALVGREARVAVDAQDRAVDARVGVDARRQARQPLAERDDQLAGRLQHEPLVVRAVRLEPGAVVVLAQVAQKVQGGGIETGEGCHGKTVGRSAVTCLCRAEATSSQ